MHLGSFGKNLKLLQADFDPRDYGYKKLLDLVKANQSLFELEERRAPGQVSGDLHLHPR